VSEYFKDAVEAQTSRAIHIARGGRPKGAKNLVEASIRWGLVEAYRQLGGVTGLVKWGQANPSLFYPMLGKLIPAEMQETKMPDQIRVLVYAPQGKTTEGQPVLIDPHKE
jgi:hypothetical protein